MENFMCHERLSFDFGEYMNFIIGHNGSESMIRDLSSQTQAMLTKSRTRREICCPHGVDHRFGRKDQ